MQTEKVLSGGINPKSSKTGGELGKVLKTKDLVIFGLVFMAPVSAQTLFGELSVLSQGHAVLSYLFALVAMLFTASSYGVMAGTFPKAGSTYSYTSQARSEEHTSELQSRFDLVCRLLLEKKKIKSLDSITYSTL